MEVDSWIVAILTAIITFGATWFTLRAQNRKLDAEGTGILVGASVELVTKLTERIDDLETQVGVLEEKVNNLKNEKTVDRELVGMLTQQVRDLGHEPVTRAQARAQLGFEP